MTTHAEIPLLPAPMRFGVILDGFSYRMTTQYRAAPDAGWLLDIDDGETGAPLAHGIALVTGLDLFEQYKYIFSGSLHVLSSGGDDGAPTFESLGAKHKLIYGYADE